MVKKKLVTDEEIEGAGEMLEILGDALLGAERDCEDWVAFIGDLQERELALIAMLDKRRRISAEDRAKYTTMLAEVQDMIERERAEYADNEDRLEFVPLPLRYPELEVISPRFNDDEEDEDEEE